MPGTVAGLALAHEKYGSGKFSLADLIEPAITLARNGVDVVDDIADTLPLAQQRIARWHSSAPVFLNSDGTVLAPGQDLLQPDLAATLRTIARDGPNGFYEGPVAEKLATAIRKAGGIMTVDDLKNYRAIERAPCAAPIAAMISSRCRRPRPAASISSRCSIFSKVMISPNSVATNRFMT